ncbi:uncharacterized protein LOC126845620 isoform X2 [Adelges cooleyi]|uniref:uncharacterized protein LOC126845620 isoform X2 n=1 Tax=Adelges cooleyi TaxID=133065 RepID=UPI00217FD78B|nr:uncharacterized protein LOC126845620 isoform X2 [Adelges cooleyi]
MAVSKTISFLVAVAAIFFVSLSVVSGGDPKETQLFNPHTIDNYIGGNNVNSSAKTTVQVDCADPAEPSTQWGPIIIDNYVDEKQKSLSAKNVVKVDKSDDRGKEKIDGFVMVRP